MNLKRTLFQTFRLFYTVAVLFVGNSLNAQTTRTESALTDSTTTVIVQLSASQKTILYNYALLQQHASTTQAEAYLQQHKATLPDLSTELCNRVAKEIIAHTQLLYTPEKASPVRLWMETQTFTEWMLYLAIFLVILALFRIFYIYRHPIRDFLIRQFAPVFRLLFSRFLVTIELLIIGAGCIAGGIYLTEMALRTIVVQTGIFLIWTQCTALFTKEYMAVDYYRYVNSTLKANNISKIFSTIFIPAIITLFAIVYAMYRLPADDWYYWEAVVVGLVAIYTLPFVKKLEYFFSWPLLFLYKENDIPRHAKPLAHYTVFTFLVCLLAAAFLPEWLKPCSACLYVLVIILLLIISTVYNDYKNKPAFIYLQFVTAAYIVFVLWKGSHLDSESMVWQAIISINLFIVIKYWQIPVVFWKMNWKRNRGWWGMLGMGAVLWLLAQGTQYFLHHYLLFTHQ